MNASEAGKRQFEGKGGAESFVAHKQARRARQARVLLLAGNQRLR
jgi:hypothetical protein